MKIIDFIEICRLQTKSEIERTTLLCYFHYKESGILFFKNRDIIAFLSDAGFNTPNIYRLRDKLIAGKNKTFKHSEVPTAIEFTTITFQQLEKEYAKYWNNEDVESDSELIDEQKFCGKRTNLTRLIQQINHCYGHNCYDACAVLMRRLFEIVLINSYQHHNIDSEIKKDDNYVMLEYIVKNAKQNQTLKLSRIKNDFDSFRDIGNYSAHSINYIAGRKDIDDIRIKYRVMLEELYAKSGIIN